MSAPPLFTPDGRYLVLRGRMCRRSDPRLPGPRRQELVDELMVARSGVTRALRTDPAAIACVRAAVGAAKTALGERGPVWWDDGAPDLNRHLVCDGEVWSVRDYFRVEERAGG